MNATAPHSTVMSAVSGRRLLLALGAWIVLSVAASVLITAVLNAVAQTWTAKDGRLLVVLAAVYLAMVVALLLVFGGPAGLRDRLGFRFTSVRDLLLALGVWVVAMVSAVLVYLGLSPILGSPSGSAVQLLRGSTDMSRLSSADPLAMSLIVARASVLAGLAEELFFRGALYGWVRKRLPALATILLTTGVFAAVHPFALLLPLTLSLGIAAGWVRERTGSTLNCFVIHAATDTSMLVAASVLVAQRLV